MSSGRTSGVAPGAKALATVDAGPGVPRTAANRKTSSSPPNPAAPAASRIFLGHDATAMKNTAWRTLLQRGTEWAATGKVTLPPAKDWPATKADAERMAMIT